MDELSPFSPDVEAALESILLGESDLNNLVRLAYRAIIKYEVKTKEEMRAVKSATRALKLRDDGNSLYEHKQYREAWRSYTESIVLAIPDSEELALAFANRSAVLFKLHKYNECFLDINRALLLGKYPESLKPKLLKRKRDCVIKIRKKNCLYDLALKKIQNINCPLTPFGAIFIPLLEVNLQQFDLVDFTTEPMNVLLPRPSVDSVNEKLPDASRKIKIHSNKNHGRYIVAAENISAGEIIATEKAFATAFTRNIKDYYLTNCSYCYVKNDALIPCNGCSSVMYCGEHCRLEAYKLYHRLECEIIQLPKSFFDTADSLSLRTLLVGTKQGKELRNLMTNQKFHNLFEDKYWPENQKYTCDYESICNLDTSRFESNFCKVVHAPSRSALMLRLLKQTSFFNASKEESDPQTPESDLTEAELFAGNLLMKHYFSSLFYSFGILQYITSMTSRYTRCECSAIGMCSVNSLVRHSCDPNAISLFNKDINFLTAMQPINAGEEIRVTWGSRYFENSREERQKRVRKYGFDCHCIPCENDWPLFNDLPTDIKFLSNNAKLKAELAKFNDQFEKWRMKSLSHTKFTCLATPSSSGWIQFLGEFSTIIKKVADKPWKTAVECQVELEHVIKTKGNSYLEHIDDFLASDWP